MSWHNLATWGLARTETQIWVEDHQNTHSLFSTEQADTIKQNPVPRYWGVEWEGEELGRVSSDSTFLGPPKELPSVSLALVH